MGDKSTRIRNTETNDAARIWELVRDCGPLDLNSSYLYLLLCLHYSGTCLVAENNKEIVGFVSSYVPPGKDGVLFVWQIAVDPKVRGQGLGKELLRKLLSQEELKGIKYVTYTISPSNQASRKLFGSLAHELNAELKQNAVLEKKLFPEGQNHEEEVLFSIGPIS